MKKIFLTSLILLILGIVCTTSAQTYNPQNTVLVFDIHEVLMDFNPTRAVKSFYNLEHKTKFIGTVLKNIFTTKKSRSLESQVILDEPSKDKALAVLNPHKPNYGTVAIIKELKTLGYQIYICSNIGEQSYEHMRKLYPDIFSLFDGQYTSNATHGNIKKNNAQFFEHTVNLIDSLANFKPEHILFIDDTRANLKLAKQTNHRFTGIVFRNSYQLRQKLKKLNLLN